MASHQSQRRTASYRETPHGESEEDDSSDDPATKTKKGDKTRTPAKTTSYYTNPAKDSKKANVKSGEPATVSNDDERFAAFLKLYGALPREGPGNVGTTRFMLAQLGPLPQSPRVIDAGCGSGAATMVLARALPRARILAVDVLEPLLDRLRAAVAGSPLATRIETRMTSMDSIDEPAASIDLIWSEGAIYNVGVARALLAWSPLLIGDGRIVFSQLCWFVGADERPCKLVEYWADAYPDMCDEAELIQVIEAAGFRCEHTRRLEPEAWFADYYVPLRERCAALLPTADAIMCEVIAEAECEIAMFEDHVERYGYTFFVVRKSDQH